MACLASCSNRTLLGCAAQGTAQTGLAPCPPLSAASWELYETQSIDQTQVTPACLLQQEELSRDLEYGACLLPPCHSVLQGFLPAASGVHLGPVKEGKVSAFSTSSDALRACCGSGSLSWTSTGRISMCLT